MGVWPASSPASRFGLLAEVDQLGLSEEKDVNRRVKAVLVYLSQRAEA